MPNNEKNAEPAVRDAQSGPHSPKMHPAPARPGRQPRTTAAMRQSPLPSNRPSALHAPITPIRPALWPRS